MAKDMELELTTPAQVPAVLAQPIDMQALMLAGLSGGATVETMERLAALCEHLQDRAAAQEFADALARFQAACPPISRTSTAKIASKSGVSYSYTYAELDEIARTIGPHLHPLGLSYTWDCGINGGIVNTTCTLRHVNGHQITASFASPIDDRASMSGPQRTASALTYAKRQALVQVLGITTAEPDQDAADPATITEDQVGNLAALIDEVGADEPKFLRWLGVERLSDLRAYEYARAVNALERKRGGGR